VADAVGIDGRATTFVGGTGDHDAQSAELR
jgi:hypothetical protein